MPSTQLRLPAPLAGFIGRAREVSEVRELLGSVRLLTLTGAGGSGKTRLALEAATQARAGYADGVGWVELAPLAQPDLVPQHVANALGIREDGAQSVHNVLGAALESQAMLLVLDNCEHLVDAVAPLVDELLRRCPRLTVLTTSQQPLRLAGEKTWLVPPLTLPPADADSDLKHIAEADAIRLFVERARDVVPRFELTEANAPVIAEICRRLDGLPLALELAAARLTVLTPEQIRDRLSNAFQLLSPGTRSAIPRHRTLRAAVDWSYELLTDAERTLLQRLSVFAGGCTLGAVEAVCGGDAVLETLTALVDRSLVVMQERGDVARYTELEMVRQYAQEKLSTVPTALTDLRNRHLAYYVGLAREAFAPIERSSAPEWIGRMGAEADNFRAALDWALGEGGNPAAALELAGYLWLVWFHGAQWSEGRTWLETALAHPDVQAPSVARVRALTGAGVLAYFFRDPQACRARFEAAITMLSGLDVPRERPLVLYRYAHLLADLGEHDRARTAASEALAIARTLSEPWILAEVLVFASAFVHRMRGELDVAETHYAEAEQLSREIGQRMVVVEAGIGRAMLALQRGDVPSAAASVRRASVGARNMRAPWFTMRVLLTAAGLAARKGDALQAVRLLSASTALSAAARAPLFPHEEPFRRGLVADLEAQLGQDAFRAEAARVATLDPAAALDLLDGHAEPEAPSAPPAAATRLSVRALGPLQIAVGGAALPPDAWRYGKARELLLYLLAHPEGRTRDQIGLALWPDASAAQVKNRFHVTAHHLRRVIGGGEWLRLERGRYGIDPGLSVDYDAARFERDVSSALRAKGKPSIDALRNAVGEYAGEFLDGEPVGDWHLEIRDRLNRLHLDAVTALAAALFAERRWPEAEQMYERLIRIDELQESAWRQLILCRARQGDRGQALRHYERLVELLKRELGDKPERETIEIVERVRRGEEG